jgi:DUF1680 family protein
LAYAGSGDARPLDRVTYIVDELARVQEVRGDGYVGGIPNQDGLFRDIETGNFFNVRQNYINNFWYTIHKIFAGLLEPGGAGAAGLASRSRSATRSGPPGLSPSCSTAGRSG